MIEITDTPAVLHTRTLLEHGDFPLHDLALLAVREGRRPRDIYTAHKWFARRLGTVFRALLVGAVSRPKDDFWSAYYDADTHLRGLTVLDPFVGGGTSVVEASRLGASTVAVDIDPIACSITSLELSAALLPDLQNALQVLSATVGKRLNKYHTFTAPDDQEYTVLHHFWVQVVSCFECGTTFDAHPNFQLAYDAKRQWVICSDCGHIQTQDVNHKTFRCKECQHRTTIMEGRVDFGRAKCPSCKHREPLIEVGRRTDSIPRWREFAVEVLTQPDGGRPVPMDHRLFFASDNETQASYNAASAAYKRHRRNQPDLFSGFEIADIDRSDTRLTDYGYRHWSDLFNARQLLHLSLLANAINTLAEPVHGALAMAFSSHLTTNCMLTSYAAGWRRTSPLFSIRAFRHLTRPVELNPWVDGSGRGSFPNVVRKLMRVAEYARSPQELDLDGGFRAVAATTSSEPPQVNCGTARDLSFLSNASVDLVLTDPPYFDNIAYSELSEFFLPWLKLLDVVSADSNVEQVLVESLVGRRNDRETIEHYTAGLSDAFREVSRVLKPSGLLMFSYRHVLPEAWLALAHAIAPHPLSAVRVLPAPGEAGNGLHTHKGTGLWDAVFVFRRIDDFPSRNADTLTVAKRDVSTAQTRAMNWANNLKAAPLPFTEIDRLTIYRASLVATVLSPKRKPSSKTTASLAQALREAT